ncbi:M3 family metallopeptidase [Psychroflexus halocasei]|uniref:oligopeptidase A n=1 Tax=Psychroflexus halocasei TaxID=908615 RepID=A0A1H3X620_9FLAO|nr:M3 family metallopeptidase [Psychroflexus halocasei]SDZ94839.1 peptidyl-dipeptidase Dcp/oligopeptidase A [Psychroflexus halocasei]
MSQDNPLLQHFEYPPFSKIKNKHFKPAIEQALKDARKDITTIAEQSAEPTFKNTLEALEFAGDQLGKVTRIFFNLNSAETNPEIQKTAQEVSPLLSEFSNDLLLNEKLFARIKSIYNQKSELDLNHEQERLLDKVYKNFTRNGANLEKEKQAQLRDIDKQLSQLSLQFGENVLAETNAFELHIEDEKELDGVPESVKDSAQTLAKEKEVLGYILTLDFPTYLPVMKFAKSRNLREKMLKGFGAKAFKDNEYNNTENVLKIVKLRYERAQLLGFETHADFVLQERMAKTPENVMSFLNEILTKAKPAAIKEFDELKSFAEKTDQITDFQKWDQAYYSEKLKQEKFDLNEDELKEYFELNNVIDGLFKVAHKLYQVNFKKNKTIDVYHEDVLVFDVTDDNGKFLATFYADFHPRAGKRDGAWMTTYKDQYVKDGKEERPQVSIVCNFTKPSAKQPSLLTFMEVTTLFHEFGHALHAMLANTFYPSLSGASVYWDFVELPSQLMENWCYEHEALELFAKHYKTEEVIPQELIEKIRKSSNFMEGLQTIRQVSFGQLDMSWHNLNPCEITDVKAHENKAFKETSLLPDIPTNCMSTAFGHIFQGGYSAGYYSYKWAEVLDADAFELFKEKGIFDSETAQKFKENVLQQGGTKDPMELYKNFRGQEPNPDALLRRAGLLENKK